MIFCGWSIISLLLLCNQREEGGRIFGRAFYLFWAENAFEDVFSRQTIALLYGKSIVFIILMSETPVDNISLSDRYQHLAIQS